MVSLWHKSAVTGALSVALLLGQAGAAKTITGAQAARASELLELCVQAVTLATSEVFDGWQKVPGFVPVGYLSYQRLAPPEQDYQVVFSQHGDKPGRPYICHAQREATTADFLSGAQTDRHITAWVNALPESNFAGVQFARHGGFAHAENAQALSACIAGQRLVLSATIVGKGAAQFGVALPEKEVLEC